MKNEEISQKTIRSYLIGAIDDPTTEGLDELSVTSQEFADRVAAEQYDLVDDWVTGRLDAAERTSFGVVLARSPTLLEKVRVSQLMTAAPRVVVERPAEPAGFFAGLFGGLPRLAYGVAGIVLLIGFVSGIVYLTRNNNVPELARVELPVNGISDNAAPTVTPDDGPLADLSTPTPANGYRPDNSNLRKPTPEPPRTGSRSFVAVVLSPPTRGAGEVKSVKIDSGVEYVDLNIQTEAEYERRLRIEIGDAASGRIEWTSVSAPVVDRNGRANIRVRVPSAKLRSGLRSIRLRQMGAENAILDEHFLRVVR